MFPWKSCETLRPHLVERPPIDTSRRPLRIFHSRQAPPHAVVKFREYTPQFQKFPAHVVGLRAFLITPHALVRIAGHMEIEDLLQNPTLLIGQIIGCDAVVVTDIAEQSLGVDIVHVDLAEVGKHNLAEGHETVEVHQFLVGVQIGTEVADIAVDLIQLHDLRDAGSYVHAGDTRHEIAHREHFGGYLRFAAGKLGQFLEKEGSAAPVGKHKAKVGQVAVMPHARLGDAAQKKSFGSIRLWHVWILDVEY